MYSWGGISSCLNWGVPPTPAPLSPSSPEFDPKVISKPGRGCLAVVGRSHLGQGSPAWAWSWLCPIAETLPCPHSWLIPSGDPRLWLGVHSEDIGCAMGAGGGYRQGYRQGRIVGSLHGHRLHSPKSLRTPAQHHFAPRQNPQVGAHPWGPLTLSSSSWLPKSGW